MLIEICDLVAWSILLIATSIMARGMMLRRRRLRIRCHLCSNNSRRLEPVDSISIIC